MKIAVVCANGREGKLIVNEAVRRGLDVTAVVRSQNTSTAPSVLQKDLFDLTKEDLQGFDAVVDAFGAWTPDTIGGIPRAVEHLCELLSGTDTRLLIVGGAGSLYVNPEHTACVAAAHDEALALLRPRRDVQWTYISPAADFQADGARTGQYTLGGEEMLLNANGESVVSYADYAIAMVDEVVGGQHLYQRISVVGA